LAICERQHSFRAQQRKNAQAMANLKDTRSGHQAADSAAARPGEPTPVLPRAEPSGRVVHDERGNAVWAFLKETSRIAIGSTSRLLKKLDVPELTMEGDEEKSAPPANGRPAPRDAGGGYDPYNQPTKPRHPGTKPKR
jgi:hypothetical protein